MNGKKVGDTGLSPVKKRYNWKILSSMFRKENRISCLKLVGSTQTKEQMNH
jgi:hypothetical protein